MRRNKYLPNIAFNLASIKTHILQSLVGIGQPVGMLYGFSHRPPVVTNNPTLLYLRLSSIYLYVTPITLTESSLMNIYDRNPVF